MSSDLDIVVKILILRGHRVACAESLTGGELASMLSSAGGASAYFVGGVVSYASSLKYNVLGVTAEQVISAECAEQMATGARDLGAEWGLSATGVAGPNEVEGRPVGMVYIGVVGPGITQVKELALSGTRAQIRAGACKAVIAMFREVLGALRH